MRAVIQRVDNARVEIDSQIVGEIDKGLLVYLGITGTDEIDDARYIADKITNLRIFSDENGKMNLSVTDVEGQVLIVSQFTLHADCRKGRRPGFSQAGDPDHAKKLYKMVIEMVKSNSLNVQTGRFGASMKVFSNNNGPVTLLVDSSKLF